MTSVTNQKTVGANSEMKSIDLELSALVGREMLVLSSQLDNKSLYSKVVMVHENIISLDRSGENSDLCQIKNNQTVVVQFDYKSQRLSAKAKLYRTMSGRVNILLNENVVPLSRRMFKRYPHECQVRCAILPVQRLIDSDISKLRWLQVMALNISSGGVLLPIPSKITDKTFMLLNINYDSPYLPNLLIGQVKHSQSINSFNYQVGIQFVINEQKENYFSSLVMKKIPPKAFDYTIKHRNRFDKFLLEDLSKSEE